MLDLVRLVLVIEAEKEQACSIGMDPRLTFGHLKVLAEVCRHLLRFSHKSHSADEGGPRAPQLLLHHVHLSCTRNDMQLEPQMPLWHA
jgi:hypothetical protein